MTADEKYCQYCRTVSPPTLDFCGACGTELVGGGPGPDAPPAAPLGPLPEQPLHNPPPATPSHQPLHEGGTEYSWQCPRCGTINLHLHLCENCKAIVLGHGPQSAPAPRPLPPQQNLCSPPPATPSRDSSEADGTESQRFCPTCGGINPPNVQYCMSCGTRSSVFTLAPASPSTPRAALPSPPVQQPPYPPYPLPRSEPRQKQLPQSAPLEPRRTFGLHREAIAAVIAVLILLCAVGLILI